MAEPFEPTIVTLDPSGAAVARRSRGPLLALGVFVLVLVLAGGAFAFARSWWTATDQSAASMIPGDVDFYVGIDAARLLDTDVQGMLDTFYGSAVDLGWADPGQGPSVDSLDTALQKELGFDFTHDIEPWVGRSVALAAEVDLPDASGTQQLLDYRPDWLMVAEVRDRGAAQAFVDRLVEAAGVGGVRTSDLDGVTLRDFDGGTTVVLDRGVLLAGSPDLVRRSLGVTEEASLASSPEFLDLTAALPEGRLLTFYSAPDAGDFDSTGSMAGMLGLGLAGTTDQLNTRAAMGLSLTDGELSFHAAARGDTGSFATVADVDAARRLPTDTLAFVTGPSLAEMWKGITSSLETAGTGMTGSGLQSSLEDELGFDVVGDLILLLDQATTVAVVPAGPGPWSDETGYPVGGLIAFGTSQPDRVGSGFDRLLGVAADSFGLSVESDGSLTGIGDTPGNAVITAGVIGDWLAVGTDPALVSGAVDGRSGSLADDTRYRDALAALPDGGGQVGGYVDITGLVNLVGQDPDVRQALAPYRSVIFGAAQDGDLTTGTLVLLFDPKG